MLQPFSELGWSGVTTRDVFNALTQVYRLHREGRNYTNEATRWRAEYYRLRDAHPRQTVGAGGVEIVG